MFGCLKEEQGDEKCDRCIVVCFIEFEKVLIECVCQKFGFRYEVDVVREFMLVVVNDLLVSVEENVVE